MQDFNSYLLTAVLLTMAIPTFGLLMGFLINVLYAVVATIVGNKKAYFVFNRLTFIGVFHHELSHALLATITGAKVTKIVFFKPEGDRLGYVEYMARGNVVMKSIQQTFSSIAPVACGAVNSVILYNFLNKHDLTWFITALFVYMMISIIIHMTMSGQDFKVMWKGMPVVYIIVAICCCIFDIRIW